MVECLYGEVESRSYLKTEAILTAFTDENKKYFIMNPQTLSELAKDRTNELQSALKQLITTFESLTDLTLDFSDE